MRDKTGAPGGIRTPDPLLRRQLLFPLSYGRRPMETVPYSPASSKRPGPGTVHAVQNVQLRGSLPTVAANRGDRFQLLRRQLNARKHPRAPAKRFRQQLVDGSQLIVPPVPLGEGAPVLVDHTPHAPVRAHKQLDLPTVLLHHAPPLSLSAECAKRKKPDD